MKNERIGGRSAFSGENGAKSFYPGSQSAESIDRFCRKRHHMTLAQKSGTLGEAGGVSREDPGFHLPKIWKFRAREMRDVFLDLGQVEIPR